MAGTQVEFSEKQLNQLGNIIAKAIDGTYKGTGNVTSRSLSRNTSTSLTNNSYADAIRAGQTQLYSETVANKNAGKRNWDSKLYEANTRTLNESKAADFSRAVEKFQEVSEKMTQNAGFFHGDQSGGFNEYKKQLAEASEKIGKYVTEAARNERNEFKSQFLGSFSPEFGKLIAEQRKARNEEEAKINEKYKGIFDNLADKLGKGEISKEKYEKSVGENKEKLNAELLKLGEKVPTSDVIKGAIGTAFAGGGLEDVISVAVDNVPGLNAIKIAVKAIQVLTSTMAQGFEQALQLQDQYLGGIDARLNGLNNFLRNEQTSYYKQLTEDMTTAFTNSQYVSMKKLTENIGKLTQAGVAYNLEERAILETIKDRMVTTFDALEGDLDRLIRLQQADVTRAQLGAESSLNSLLNSMFSDTSYLNNQYDQVSSTLLEATSNKSYKEAVEINFAAQKWLGSLYSLGMSSGAVSNIAQGLTNLATGNIEQLNGTAIGNLFALSSRNAGISYTDILTNGLNASNINGLLKSMIEYLQQVAQNTSGNVAKTAIYNAVGGGFSYSDVRAIQNMTSDEINRLYSVVSSFDKMQSVANEDIAKVASRTSTYSRVGNIRDNLLLSMGTSMIGENGGLTNYVLYSIADMLPGLVGEAAKTLWGIGNIVKGVFDGEPGFISKASLSQMLDEFVNNDGSWLQSNVETFRNFDFSEINPRGAYIPPSLVSPGQVSTGVSVSSTIASGSRGGGTFGSRTSGGGIFSGASRSEAAEYSLYEQANATTLSASNRTGTAAMIRDVGDIYAELFENQTKPIRVAVAKLEEEAINNLNIGPNGMLVDIQDNDVNTLISQVYRVRSAY